MTDYIQFDPAKKPGTEEPHPSGGVVRFVGATEYFPRLLGEVTNATVVFLHAHAPGTLSPEQQKPVDDAIADAYWNTYLGCLMPPNVMRAIGRIADGPSGDMLLADLEDARKSIFAAPSIDDAVEIHATYRIQMLVRGAEGMLTDVQSSLGELMTDYLLVQRGIAEDIRRSERERAKQETRGAVLARLDRSADLQFERLLGHVLHPKRVYQMIPKNRRRELEKFAQSRRPLHTTGVLAEFPGTPA